MFFSIIIPTYNRSEQLLKTIDSIKIQNFLDYEIIIVDDFSDDDTITKLESYKKENNYLNIIVEKLLSNSGPNIARNIGTKLSNGKYLIFLDSDDEFYDLNTLSEIKETIINEQFPIILMFSSYYTKEKKIVNFQHKFLDFKGFLNSKNNGEFLPVVEAAIFKNIFFPTGIRGGEGITWLSITKVANKVVYSSKVVRLYNNIDENRLSTFSISYCARLYNVYKLYFKTFWFDLLLLNFIGFFKIFIRIIFYKLASNRLIYLLIIKFKTL